MCNTPPSCRQRAGLAVANTATWHTKQKLPDSAPLHVVSLSHAASSEVATWVNTLWSISQKAMAGSSRVEEELIKYVAPHPQALCATNRYLLPSRPWVVERQQGDFDLSLLADFRERPQLQHVVLCERVKPLLQCPGRIMVTDEKLYFQPAQVNNVGDEVSRYVCAAGTGVMVGASPPPLTTTHCTVPQVVIAAHGTCVTKEIHDARRGPGAHHERQLEQARPQQHW